MTRGEADPEVVRRHLAAMREALANLGRHAGLRTADLQASADLRWAVERGLQLCVQNALDIATHLAAASGLDAPDYASAIDRMAELGVLPGDLALRLRPMAGFRNVLVHGYLQVSLAIVERVLREELPYLAEFARRVEAHLARS